MPTVPGRGAGIVGLVDQTGTLIFKANVTENQGKVFAKIIDITGRGDNGYGTTLLEDISGSGHITGIVMDKYPLAVDFRGAGGTLTYTHTTGASVSFPANVSNIEFYRLEKNQNKEKVSFDWVLNGAYTIVNPSSNPASPSGSLTQKEVYDGLQKTQDPTSLVTAAIQRIRVTNVADNDAAEVAAINAVLATVSPPVSGLVISDAVFTRSGNRGGFVIVNWALRNHQQAIEQDASEQYDDPNDLKDYAEIAQVQNSATPSTPPNAPLSTKYIGVSTKQLNNGKWLQTYKYAERDSKDEIQMDGTKSDIDPATLEDGGEATLVTDDSSQPSAPDAPGTSKVVRYESQQLNDGKWRHLFTYATNTSQEAIERHESRSGSDPQGLDNDGVIVQITDSSTAPSVPTPPAGSVYYGVTGIQQTDGYWKWTFRYEPRNTQQDIEMPGTDVDLDQSTVPTQDGGKSTLVTDSGTPPAAPAAPGVSKLQRIVTVQKNPTRWAHTFFFGAKTAQDEIEMGESVVRVDPIGINSQATLATVTDDSYPTPPAECQLYETVTTQLKDGSIVTRIVERVNNSQNEIEFAGTRSERSPVGEFIDVVSQIITVDAGDSVSAIANTEFALFITQDFAYQQVVRRKTPTIAEVISTYKNAGVTLFGSTYGDPRWVDAKLDTDGSTVLVYVSQVKTRGSGQNWVQVVPFQIFSAIRRFTIRRQIQDTTVPDYQDQVDTVNNADFLGLGAGKVQYLGAEYEARIDLSTTRTFFMSYHFYYDPNGIFGFQGLRQQWFQTSATPTVGFVDITTLISGGFDSTLPDQSDFSVFDT